MFIIIVIIHTSYYSSGCIDHETKGRRKKEIKNQTGNGIKNGGYDHVDGERPGRIVVIT